MSEIMLAAIEPTVHEFGLNNVFVGVLVVAILGNAAEHATAITVALEDRMDLSLSIAIGSSVQVALLVAPRCARQPFYRLYPHGLGLQGWTRPDGSFVHARHGSGCGEMDGLTGLRACNFSPSSAKNTVRVAAKFS